MDQQVNELDPRESLRLAKIEHYVDAAQECLRMTRYGAARRHVDKALQLDPANAEAKGLERAIEEREAALLADFAHGVSRSFAGGGNGIHHQSRLVLLIDQDERVLESLATSLLRDGFVTVAAGDFQEAVDLLGTVRPDVVVSEVNFARGPQGFDLYHRVRSDQRLADTAFVFLAATLDRNVLIAGKRFGVDDFITKPADTEVITAAVVNCLARRRAALAGR